MTSPAAWFPLAMVASIAVVFAYELWPGHPRRGWATSDERWSYIVPAETDPYIKQPGDLSPREAIEVLSRPIPPRGGQS